MNREAIKNTVESELHKIAPEADLGRLDPGADLRDALDIDSMDMLRLITGLSQRIGFDVPKKDYARLTTLAGCIEYMAEKSAKEAVS